MQLGKWGAMVRGQTETLWGMFGGSRLGEEIAVSLPRSPLERGKETSRNEPRMGFITGLIQTLCLYVYLIFKRMYSTYHGKPVVSGQFNDAVKCGLWLTFSMSMPAGNCGFIIFFNL